MPVDDVCLVYGHGAGSTIKLDNVDLQVAFNEIKQKMGYTFVYNDQVVKNVGKISVNVTSSDIRQILAKCLEGTSLDFYIEDNIVVIKAKTEQSVRETEKKPVTVKGKVVDEKRQALPGVTVLIKGTTLGVTTGVEGDFDRGHRHDECRTGVLVYRDGISNNSL